MPASISTSAGEELVSVGLSCLSRDKEKGLEIFADVLFNPAFRQDKLDLAKKGAMEGQRRKNDTPVSISRRAFRDILYGPRHPYAHNQTVETIKKVKRKDLVQLYKKLVVPDHAYVAVWGDFEKEAMVQKLEELLGHWKKTGRRVPVYDYSLQSPPDGENFLC